MSLSSHPRRKPDPVYFDDSSLPQNDDKQNATNKRRLPCGHRILSIVIGLLKLLKCEARHNQLPTNGMNSSEYVRTQNRLNKEDGHTNGKERQRPCNLVEVEQDAALHISPLTLIVTGAPGRCCQENSAKCEDL